jgi:hypothetical protein
MKNVSPGFVQSKEQKGQGAHMTSQETFSGPTAGKPLKVITVRIFVEGDVCHSVLIRNPNADLPLDIEAEIYDADGDYGEEYEEAMKECEQDSIWKGIA